MSLVAQLKTLYLGKKTNDVIDKVTSLVTSHRCTIEVQDPEWNVSDIDKDNTRIVLHQDSEGNIVNFTVG